MIIFIINLFFLILSYVFTSTLKYNSLEKLKKMKESGNISAKDMENFKISTKLMIGNIRHYFIIVYIFSLIIFVYILKVSFYDNGKFTISVWHIISIILLLFNVFFCKFLDTKFKVFLVMLKKEFKQAEKKEEIINILKEIKSNIENIKENNYWFFKINNI